MQTGRSRWRVTASSSTEDRQRPKPIAAAPPFQTQPTCPPSRKTRRAAPARQAVLALVTRHGRARRCPRRTPRAELDLRPTSSTGVTITQPSSASSPRIERAESPARRSEAVGRSRIRQPCAAQPGNRVCRLPDSTEVCADCTGIYQGRPGQAEGPEPGWLGPSSRTPWDSNPERAD